MLHTSDCTLDRRRRDSWRCGASVMFAACSRVRDERSRRSPRSRARGGRRPTDHADRRDRRARARPGLRSTQRPIRFATGSNKLIDRELVLAEVDRYAPPEPAADAVDREMERGARAVRLAGRARRRARAVWPRRAAPAGDAAAGPADARLSRSALRGRGRPAPGDHGRMGRRPAPPRRRDRSLPVWPSTLEPRPGLSAARETARSESDRTRRG